MLLWCDVTQHSAAKPANHRSADGGRNVIVSRRDVRRQWPECVERRFMALLELLFHVDLNQVHGQMPRTFDHRLYVMFPGNLRQLAESLQFAELRFVIRISDRTRTQSIA